MRVSLGMYRIPMTNRTTFSFDGKLQLLFDEYNTYSLSNDRIRINLAVRCWKTTYINRNRKM